MNIFNTVNQKVQEVIKGESTGDHVGHYLYEDLDGEDKQELESWEAIGEGFYIKVIKDIEFTLSIITS